MLPFCPRDLSVEFIVLEGISLGLLSVSRYPNFNAFNNLANNEYDKNFC